MKIEEINIDCAEEILRILDPAVNSWSEWVFRGQSDSEFKLIPAIWREERRKDFNKFKSSIDSSYMRKHLNDYMEREQITFDVNIINNIIEALLFIKFENYILSSFYERANAAGLKIPSRAMQLLNVYNPDYWRDEKSLSFGLQLNNYHDIIQQRSKQVRYSSPLLFEPQIPQHYGLPTRILDWTTNPRKAIFFAAYDFLKNRESKSKKIAIYAFRINTMFNRNGENPILLEKLHNRYNNKFLHHQDGCFTRTYSESFYYSNGEWPSIEKTYEEIENENICVKKYNIDAKHVKEILERLYRSGISISSIMPDYTHVAEETLVDLL